jgi:hypothetical protein
MLLYLYLITLCKMHVHCDIIFMKLQAQFNSLSLSFVGNTKTRISNIVVVYIDVVFIFIHLLYFILISALGSHQKPSLNRKTKTQDLDVFSMEETLTLHRSI